MSPYAIGTSLIVRLETRNSPGAFGTLASKVGEVGGIVSAVDTRSVTKSSVVFDVSILVASEAVGNAVCDAIEVLPGVRIISVSDSTFLAHLGGKIRIAPKMPVRTRADLSTVYTPGVARVSLAIAKDPAKAYNLTIKRNTVGVISDGTAVLGLGDIGPLAALPVMEGKCMLFKQFADIDAFPITLDTKDVNETGLSCAERSLMRSGRRPRSSSPSWTASPGRWPSPPCCTPRESNSSPAITPAQTV